MASHQLDEPRVITAYKLQVDRKALGVTFKGDQKKARRWLVLGTLALSVLIIVIYILPFFLVCVCFFMLQSVRSFLGGKGVGLFF